MAELWSLCYHYVRSIMESPQQSPPNLDTYPPVYTGTPGGPPPRREISSVNYKTWKQLNEPSQIHAMLKEIFH